MTLIRQNCSTTQAPPAFDRDGEYSDSDQIDDPYSDEGDGLEFTYEDILLTYPKRDDKWTRYLDPNPQSTNSNLAHCFERLEPRRRSTLVSGKLTPADLAAARSGGRAYKGQYFPVRRETTRSLCGKCRALPFWDREPCHVCVVTTRYICISCTKIFLRSKRPRFCEECKALNTALADMTRPSRMRYEEYLTHCADELLRKAAKKEYVEAGCSPNVCPFEEWVDTNNLLFKTRSDTPPLAYSHIGPDGRWKASTFAP